MNNSLTFGMFTMMCNNHLYLVSKYFHHCKAKLLNYEVISPSLHPLITTSLHPIYGLTYSGYSYKWNNVVFCDCLLHLSCFGGSSTLKHVSVFDFFSPLNNIPLYAYTIICWPSHSFIDLWAVVNSAVINPQRHLLVLVEF